MIYKVIPSFTDYEISEFGDVRRATNSRSDAGFKAGRPVKTYNNRLGYVYVPLYVGGRRRSRPIHRLVHEAFIGPIPDGLTINHKDGNNKNNHHSNLECMSLSDNVKDSWRRSTRAANLPKGEAHKHSKLTEADVRAMRAMYAAGATTVAIGKAFGTPQSNAHLIVTNRAWRHVTPQP